MKHGTTYNFTREEVRQILLNHLDIQHDVNVDDTDSGVYVTDGGARTDEEFLFIAIDAEES